MRLAARARRAAAATRAVTASTPPGTATAATRIFPDASAPPTTTRAAAAEEITPPASSDQPASGASAPCRVKRRNVNAVARAGPASGTETDTALAAQAVASIGRISTLAPPAASSLRSMIAKAAMDTDSSRTAAGIHSQCR
jgi:hypothetical protein